MALTGTNNEQKIWNYLKSKGLNDCGAAGLMGNLYAESALRPTNLQNSYEKSLGYTDDSYTAAVDSGSYGNFVMDKAGYGLAQWTYWSRKQNLQEYAKSAGKSIGDLEMQLGFLHKELSECYKSVFNAMKTATTVREASDAVLLQYERPANQGTTVQETRAKYGQTYFDKYAKKPATEGSKTKMNLHKLIFVNNACYKAGKAMTPKGIMVHSTGAENPWLKRYVGPDDGLLGKNQYNNHWNQAMDRQVCVHGFIGKLADGTIATYQTLPWDMVGWHSGSGSKGNANSLGYIGFEICEDDLTDATYFKKVYDEAVALCAYLCKTYNIKPESPTLICHSEGCKLGIASNHGDVMHWFPKHGKSMDTFRADVKAAMGTESTGGTAGGSTGTSTEMYRVRKTWADAASQKGAYKNLEYAKTCANQNPGYSVFNSAGAVVYSTTTAAAPEKKTVAQLAVEVIDEKWGNGDARKKALEAAGYSYAEVQAAVNAKLSGGKKQEDYATYTVVKGDSLWLIAKKKLGNGSRWPEIRTLNGLTSNVIYAGQKLKLPK